MKMTDGKICPKCSKKDLNAFCGEMIKRMDGGSKVTTDEWDKTHKVPDMKLKDSLYSGNNKYGVDIYECPVCGYIEYWRGKEFKP